MDGNCILPLAEAKLSEPFLIPLTFCIQIHQRQLLTQPNRINPEAPPGAWLHLPSWNEAQDPWALSSFPSFLRAFPFATIVSTRTGPLGLPLAQVYQRQILFVFACLKNIFILLSFLQIFSLIIRHLVIDQQYR